MKSRRAYKAGAGNISSRGRKLSQEKMDKSIDGKFFSISHAYDALIKGMLAKGQLPVKDTKIGFWGPASISLAFEMFQKLKLQKFRSFIDLGSGDGRITLLASLFCNTAHGVEYSPELHEKAQEIALQAGISNAEFFNSDFHDHDISGYDAVFINPDKPMGRGTEEKLLKELQGKLLVYGHHFHPETLKKEQEVSVDGCKVTVYGKS
ncbi:methyltransferase domain-containing protein [Candidatus Woesearchaeota archaeon]|nr:methyltransferase domain-containing protein [Candidatus Woesearchaeota archaeon]